MSENLAFKVPKPFIIRTEFNESVLSLLKKITLGSNGAKYQHQKIDERIAQLYRPIYINLERNNNVIGNLTFCRRPKDWYVRYFAFDMGFQTSIRRKASNENKRGNLLKSRMNLIFDSCFASEDAPMSIYAYIDPKNERSLLMSRDFGFKTIGKIATQTYSRTHPKKQKNVSPSPATDFIKSKVEEAYKNHAFYTTFHTFDDTPFYVLKEDEKIVAFAKVYEEEWKMEQLPGRFGGILKKIIPFTPGFRKIIRPNAHVFSVIDSVWCESGKEKQLSHLFEGILAEEKTNSFLWWVDKNEDVYCKVKNNIKWGLLHKINGITEVDVVAQFRDPVIEKEYQSKKVYVSGFDLI